MTEAISYLGRLRELQATLIAGRQEYDFQPSTLISHAEHYASDLPRLRRYARQVVSSHIMVLLASSRMTTQGLLQTYLSGADQRCPYALVLAARSQLELFAVVADAARVVRENAGQHEDHFAQRVARVDRTLIKAIYGTRSQQVKDLLPRLGLSRLREHTSADLEVLSATNVLSRVQRLAKEGSYPDCERDYERLCEYVHPNWGMNMLLLVQHPSDHRLLRLSTLSEAPFARAFEASCVPMWRAAEGTVRSFDKLDPPFGAGQMTSVH